MIPGPRNGNISCVFLLIRLERHRQRPRRVLASRRKRYLRFDQVRIDAGRNGQRQAKSMRPGDLRRVGGRIDPAGRDLRDIDRLEEGRRQMLGADNLAALAKHEVDRFWLRRRTCNGLFEDEEKDRPAHRLLGIAFLEKHALRHGSKPIIRSRCRLACTGVTPRAQSRQVPLSKSAHGSPSRNDNRYRAMTTGSGVRQTGGDLYQPQVLRRAMSAMGRKANSKSRVKSGRPILDPSAVRPSSRPRLGARDAWQSRSWRESCASLRSLPG